MSDETSPPARKRVNVGVGIPAWLHLNAFGHEIFQAFGTHAYLVGSAALGKGWRDIDVRLMLDDEQFDALFPGHTKPDATNPRWALTCAAISELARARTGLPVDFQIQRLSTVNDDDPASYYAGPRCPLGIYVHPEREQ